jgi:acyl-CoA hydrolase
MSYSTGSITTFVMPHMQNVRGDLFGGELMALVDQAAAVAAIRHAGGPAVTASIERVDFRERIPVGALVTCAATVDYVGNSSMDITVEVYAENVSTGERSHTNTAHVVFVGIDGNGRPRRVPRLLPESAEERDRYARAEEHRHRQQQHQRT